MKSTGPSIQPIPPIPHSIQQLAHSMEMTTKQVQSGLEMAQAFGPLESQPEEQIRSWFNFAIKSHPVSQGDMPYVPQETGASSDQSDHSGCAPVPSQGQGEIEI